MFCFHFASFLAFLCFFVVGTLQKKLKFFYLKFVVKNKVECSSHSAVPRHSLFHVIIQHPSQQVSPSNQLAILSKPCQAHFTVFTFWFVNHNRPKRGYHVIVGSEMVLYDITPEKRKKKLYNYGIRPKSLVHICRGRF